MDSKFNKSYSAVSEIIDCYGDHIDSNAAELAYSELENMRKLYDDLAKKVPTDETAIRDSIALEYMKSRVSIPAHYNLEDLATESYKMADAMLWARKQG